MTARFRRVAVFVGAAALATGAGVGVAAQGDSTPSDRTSQTQQMGPGGGPPAGGGLDVSALADELGVTETELQQAMQNARPTDPSTAGGPDAMFEALASDLGVSVEKVRAAFEKIALPTVRFSDRYGALESVDDIVEHAGATLRFMPGATLERNGQIRHCQGSVLANWASGAGTGTNLFVLAPDGRIAAVVGFQDEGAREPAAADDGA